MWTNRVERDRSLQELAKTDALGTPLPAVIATALETHTGEWKAFQARAQRMDCVQIDVSELGNPDTLDTRFQAEINESLWKEFAALTAIRSLLRENKVLSPATSEYTEDKAGPWIHAAQAHKVFARLSPRDQLEGKIELCNLCASTNQLGASLSDVADITVSRKLGTEASKPMVALLELLSAERVQLKEEMRLLQHTVRDHTLLGLIHDSLRVRIAIAKHYSPSLK